MKTPFQTSLNLVCTGFVCVWFFLFSPSLCAQDRIQFGVGVGLNPAPLLGDRNTTLQPQGVVLWYVPCRIGEYLRVEPELGYQFYKDRNEDDPTRDVEVTQSFVRIGMGVFYEWKPFATDGDSLLRVYAGGRIGVLSYFMERNYFLKPNNQQIIPGGDGVERASLYYLAVFGVEYMLGKRFGIGAEIQFARYEFGEARYRFGVPPPTYPRYPQSNVLTTSAMIFLRFYF
jgi:hypothetical protein